MNPLDIACPICDQPKGAACRGGGTHAARFIAAADEREVDGAAPPAKPKPRPTLLPADSLLAVAQLITEQQDARGDSWLDVPAEDHLDAAQRHLLKHQAGELLDESGHPHEVHAAARLLMAIAVRQRASTTNERRNPE